MKLKLFTDLIDALCKVASRLREIVNLPKAGREKYRQTLDEIYRLIDTTLNRVIIWLGDILLQDGWQPPLAQDRSAGLLRRMDTGGVEVPVVPRLACRGRGDTDLLVISLVGSVPLL